MNTKQSIKTSENENKTQRVHKPVTHNKTDESETDTMVLVERITHSSVFMWMFSAQMVVDMGYHSELQRRTKCS